MKIRHKIISMITAIIFLAGMFSVIHLTAAAYGTYGNLTYNTYDSDGDGVYDYLTIANCAQPVTEVEIPAEIDGVPVTEIQQYAFGGCNNLKNVIIPDRVVKIGKYAFYDCRSLKEITIPESVASIDNCAFKNCSVLETVLIKNPECEIYDSADTIFNNLIFDEETGEDFNCFNGTIYGYENSTAQAYAEKYGYNFKLFVQGDISKNDLIDLYDAIEVVKYIMKIRTFTETDKQFADFTGNGVVDLYDAIEIARTLI